MNHHPHLHYTDKHTLLTLREGLDIYYAENPNITDPRQLKPEFARILQAHDVSHVVYACDTRMYDELKLLPLTWWTSNYRFRDHMRTLQDPLIGRAVKIMYDDLIKKHGNIGLYSSILLNLLLLLPELMIIWLKVGQRNCWFPFLEFEPWLDRSLVEIREKFDLMPFIKDK